MPYLLLSRSSPFLLGVNYSRPELMYYWVIHDTFDSLHLWGNWSLTSKPGKILINYYTGIISGSLFHMFILLYYIKLFLNSFEGNDWLKYLHKQPRVPSYYHVIFYVKLVSSRRSMYRGDYSPWATITGKKLSLHRLGTLLATHPGCEYRVRQCRSSQKMWPFNIILPLWLVHSKLTFLNACIFYVSWLLLTIQVLPELWADSRSGCRLWRI